jgi:hypothetical protein
MFTAGQPPPSFCPANSKTVPGGHFLLSEENNLPDDFSLQPMRQVFISGQEPSCSGDWILLVSGSTQRVTEGHFFANVTVVTFVIGCVHLNIVGQDGGVPSSSQISRVVHTVSFFSFVAVVLHSVLFCFLCLFLQRGGNVELEAVRQCNETKEFFFKIVVVVFVRTLISRGLHGWANNTTAEMPPSTARKIKQRSTQ